MSALRTARALVRAYRPLAAANLAPPLLLGLAAARFFGHAIDGPTLAFVALFGLVDQAVILFANDVHDAESDEEARTLVSGGSGVLLDGSIAKDTLRRASWVADLLLVALAAAHPARAGLVPAAAVAVALVWAYGAPPLRLGHAGGGEWLQGIGVGFILPFVAFHAASGAFVLPHYLVAAGVLAAAGSNALTSLPDEQVDRRANKRAPAARWGGPLAARFALVAIGIAGTIVIRFAPLDDDAKRVIALATGAPLALALLLLRRVAPGHLAFVFAGASAHMGLLLSLSWALVDAAR